MRKVRAPRGRGSSCAASIVLALLFSAGVVLAAAPLARDLAWSHRSRQVISQMTSGIDRTNDPDRLDVLREAQAYNLALGGAHACVNNQHLRGGNGGTDDIATLAHAGDESGTAYQGQLLWNGMAAICWVEIPALSVCEPVYHGTSDDVLAQGVGHLEWSSLPVGGESSHCVLAAHSGMEESQMFDGLGSLGAGDLVVLHTLGDAYAYRVFESEVVLPQDAESRCTIIEGKDLCTLITCTPYGINTHRLLVHAERIAYDARGETATPVRAYVNRRTIPVLGIGGMVGISSAGTLVLARMRRRRRATSRPSVGYHHRRHPHLGH